VAGATTYFCNSHYWFSNDLTILANCPKKRFFWGLAEEGFSNGYQTLASELTLASPGLTKRIFYALI